MESKRCELIRVGEALLKAEDVPTCTITWCYAAVLDPAGGRPDRLTVDLVLPAEVIRDALVERRAALRRAIAADLRAEADKYDDAGND